MTNDEELLQECKIFLERICNTVGETITEYHWRDAAALSSMIDDNINKIKENGTI